MVCYGHVSPLWSFRIQLLYNWIFWKNWLNWKTSSNSNLHSQIYHFIQWVFRRTQCWIFQMIRHLDCLENMIQKRLHVKTTPRLSTSGSDINAKLNDDIWSGRPSLHVIVSDRLGRHGRTGEPCVEWRVAGWWKEERHGRVKYTTIISRREAHEPPDSV